ncbi:MAG: glycosyltransferase family 2 protein [Candidatus Hydrogenedentes bacterium]|nr:glycosyltransferase family 2 protein [Candidatus Hydrogenedentota bacterium]
MRVSLVIPAYNEATRIGATLTDVRGYFANQPYDSEIIVVDDGSADNTANAVGTQFPDVRVIAYQPNRGKGNAVRAGMLHARGEIRVYYDADGSTPISELEKLLPHFDAGADIVIGSRLMDASQIEIHQGVVREAMGRMFNRVMHTLGLTELSDTQCGFKAFTARATDICFTRQTLERFSFDVEVLYIAQRHGLKIVEVPIRWLNNPDSRVRMVRDAIPTMRDILAIRRNSRMGVYD